MSSRKGQHLNITYRLAHLEEGQMIASMIYDAAARMTSHTLDADREESIAFIKFCFDKNLGFYGHAHQHVAVVNDQLAMTATMYSGKAFKRLVWQFIVASFKYFGFFRASKLMYRSLDLGKLYETPNDRSLFLANACVFGSMRGRGIFTRFLAENVHAFAHQHSLNTIELDVGLDNPHAEKLYQRLGFITQKVNQYSGKADIAGVKRMDLSLL